MKRKTLSRIANLYFLLVAAAFTLYVYQVQEKGIIDTQSQKGNLIWFVILFLVALVLSGIMMSSTNGNRDRIDSRTILGGIIIAMFFLVWRVAMAII